MKLILAIIQPSKLDAVKAALNKVEVFRLTVVDDGEGGGASTPSASGFGLIGMAERAKLLGGTFDAGPSASGGWTVEATLPRQAATR